MTMEQTDQAQAIAAGYTFDAPTLDLGALMADGTPDPEVQIRIPLAMLTRHGLVAGATGTGKTKTLQGLAEQLSAAGVPVFLADMKGDLSGMAAPGDGNEKLTARTQALGQQWSAKAFPCEFYALGGEGTGIPVRATVSAFGPTMLAKVLGLNATQESSLGLVFHFADTKNWLLLDLKDLRSVLLYLTGDEGKAELKAIGGLSPQTAGVILRELTAFQAKGAEPFFGETEFDALDLIRTTPDGRGVVSLLELPGVASRPELFSTFLMWLVAELFERLPEVGDVDRPKLVFFFDEAHLLFNGASKPFVAAITQAVRLIRSKGVGIFFVTQTPKDVPGDVLAQLGNRVQHALRAYTPDDAKALKATVSTFPKSPYDLAEVLQNLGIGEAVVTVLSENGAPTPVAWTRLRAPESLMAEADPAVVQAIVNASPLLAKYGPAIDRESAYEILAAKELEAQLAADDRRSEAEVAQAEREASRSRTSPAAKAPPNLIDQYLGSGTVKQAVNTAVRELTRSIFGTRRRR
ncbi:helicase HerA-like domain-containing protein [Catenulispora rubra]|uniref:helicase HerA-like domain-containing protein n=1 Tax=Catenulispora rubra TaxID=280293 RepID=UPI001891F833